MRLAIVNPRKKAGDNSTTLAFAKTLVQRNKKVLIIDLDPLAHLTYELGINYAKKTITDVLSWDEKLENVIIEAGDIDIVASDIRLAAIEISLAWTDNREIYLKTALDLLQKQYDYVILNCTATLSFMTINALYACDVAILPTDNIIKNKEELDEEMAITLGACEELLGSRAVKVDNRSNVYEQFFTLVQQKHRVLLLEQPIWTEETIEPVLVPVMVPSPVGKDIRPTQEILLNYKIFLN